MSKRGITKNEERKLNILFQEIKLEQTPDSEISGAKAECVHHFFRKSDSMRWYLPGGVSLTAEEHNIIDSSDSRMQEFEEKIIEQRGRQWFADLTRRKFKVVKYITYQGVLNYLNGQSPDYI